MKGAEEFILNGNNKLLLGDYKGAIFEFTKAVMTSPLNPYPYASRGIAKLELRDYEGAIYDCEQAINLHYRNEKSPESVDDKIKKKYTTTPDNKASYARLYSIIGVAKLLQGDKKDALLHLHTARLLGYSDIEYVIESYYRD